MTDAVTLVWKVLRVGGRVPDPTYGYAYDSGVAIGWVKKVHDPAGFGEWSWSLTTTGAIKSLEFVKEDRGRAPTKEAAKAAVTAAYAKLLALHPDNRRALIGQSARVDAGMEQWAKGRPAGQG